jgi:indolepyruvate ferredoxin oxidoreductase beta subunit
MDTLNANAGPPRLDTRRPTTIAVLAMGGQGGGVLVDWIVELARAQGHLVQATSVPGVAQRTGATIYYVEMIAADGSGRRPVLSLLPAPGEVDIVIGAELMEAGRAIQRGLVSPSRTTLIASSHRAYAVSEKVTRGDGAGDSGEVYAAARVSARRFVAFDMAAIADEAQSHISASLLGALAGSGALPFPKQAYEDTIREGGVGVEASLRAFARAYDRAREDVASGRAPATPRHPSQDKLFPALQPVGHAGFDALVARARSTFPEAAHPMIAAGLVRVVDFQDVAYGAEYLDLVEGFAAIEGVAGGEKDALIVAASKNIARAMAYDDVIRVADLKTRGRRFERVRNEVAATPDQIVYQTEFMHPGMEEVCGTLPAAVGLWIEGRPRLFARLQRIVSRGRRVNTGMLRWFVPLYLVAGLRRFRRGTLRHRRERAHLDAWLARATAAARRDIALGIEILEARRLVKGYSDTRAGGETRFGVLMTMAERLEGRKDAAEWIRRLRLAALADADGVALAGAVKTVESFLEAAP